MSKPLSRPNELGRAIGYNVDVGLVVESLKHTPLKEWDKSVLQQVGRAVDSTKVSSGKARLWLVVKAEHGVPVLIDVYPDKRSASRREKFLRLHLQPASEEVGLYEIKL